MRLFAFGPDTGQPLTQFESQAAVLARLVRSPGPLELRLVYLMAGGGIGAHPAGRPQMLCVLLGAGQVCGRPGLWRDLAAGQAAVWETGEIHATRSAQGLTALLVEGAELEPWAAEIR